MPTPKIEEALSALRGAIAKADRELLSVRSREHLMRPVEFQREQAARRAEARETVKAAREAVDVALRESRSEAQQARRINADEAARRTMHATRALAIRDDSRALAAAIRQAIAGGDQEAAQEYLSAGRAALVRDLPSNQLLKFEAQAAGERTIKQRATLVGLDAAEQQFGWLDKHVETALERVGNGNLDALENRPDPTRGIELWADRVTEQASAAAVAYVEQTQTLAASDE